jgi:hypothetical protein
MGKKLVPKIILEGTRLTFKTEIAFALNERLKVSGNPSQYDNLQIFIEEQELLRRLADESILPRLELDISDNNIPNAVERIADWMESTGGLWMNE